MAVMAVMAPQVDGQMRSPATLLDPRKEDRRAADLVLPPLCPKHASLDC